jgi:hypothetical protein
VCLGNHEKVSTMMMMGRSIIDYAPLLLLVPPPRADHPRPGTNSLTLVGFRSDDDRREAAVDVAVLVVVAVVVVLAAIPPPPGFHSGAPVDKPIILVSRRLSIPVLLLVLLARCQLSPPLPRFINSDHEKRLYFQKS